MLHALARRSGVAFVLLLASSVAIASDAASPVKVIEVLGIPIEFILFALTLLGVALLHNQTFYVALAGVLSVALYKIVFTGFKTGAGVAGFAGHLGHEWVTLANLFCLLMGFALLARHFEKSRVPEILPKVPARRLERRLPAAGDHLVHFQLPRQHRRRADRRRHGAQACSRRKVHIGYLAGYRCGLQCRWLRARWSAIPPPP